MAKAKVNRRVSVSAARATAQRRRSHLLWSGGIAVLVVALIAVVVALAYLDWALRTKSPAHHWQTLI
jgi:hypothetical protein